jgi:hypothetical protein
VRLIIFIFRSITILVFATIPSLTIAQDRCGTVEYMKTLQGERFYENRLNFEQWLEQRMQAEKRQGLHRQQAIYQIPVVVHVIHSGEAIGTGRNISDAQILSQISVLNRDYNRLNTDAANTPPEYQSLAGSFEVEFVLAKQNPEGLSTTGIVRVQGPKSSWSINDNYELKSLSYWPAEDYLNIWVCNLSGLLGYAQFPVSGMPGLGNSSNNRLTDGIVVTNTAFGSEEDGNFNLLNKYKRGRTTTHEMGHFFGLRHIWGDDEGQCDGSDFVDDTPNQAGSTSGCPTQPLSSCGTTSMHQNFLDYTDDACMNLFTLGQVDRMTTVLENSPRRATLLTSHGLSDPLPVANDLGVREIISPLSGECNTLVTPVIDIRNYGSNSASSTQINVKVDDILVETKNFALNPALSPLGSTTLNFSPTSLTSGLHTVTFEIVLTNTTPDGSAINNTISQQVLIPETIALPVTENFNSLPPSWQIINPDGKTTWELATAPNADPSNTAMKMDFYDYEDNLGEVDLLITPVFDLTNAPVALLLFDVAYARFNDDNDGLKVVVLSDCNADINQGTVVYEKTGASLETRSPSTNEFIPVNESQWRNEFIDLSAFAGQNNLQLAFVGINDWGNNLYLDNISIITTPLNDVALETIISPSPVLCSNQVNPRIRVKNIGTLLTSVKARAIINGQSSEVQTFSELSLLGGNTLELELSPITLATGANTVYVELLEPSGLPDVNPSNNSKTSYSVVNNASDEIPVRENFEEEFEDQWTIINPSGGMNWEEKRIGSNNTLFFNAFNNQVIEDKSWLVSPVLDFSATTAATLSFDLSYAYRSSANDQLLILTSRDCGITYSDTVFNASRIELANAVTSSTSWEPGDSVWQRNKEVNLTVLAGEPEVRIAFVFINQNGNNIYLDNIEFFVSEKPIPIDNQMSVYPNPFNISEQTDSDPLRVTFNLPEKGPVLIEMIDLVGRILMSEIPPNVLNQTYMISVPDIPAGTYIVRATTQSGIFTQRVIILK